MSTLQQKSVLHLPMDLFDRSGKARDQSRFRQNAAKVGTISLADDLLFGKVMQFNDTHSYLDCSSPSHYNLPNGYTLSVWVNLTVPISAQNTAYPILLSKRDVDTQRTFMLSFQKASGKVYFEIKDTGGTYHTVLSEKNDFEVGKWMHIAASFDPATGLARVFLNGKENNSKVFSLRSVPVTSARARIGGSSGGYKINAKLAHLHILDAPHGEETLTEIMRADLSNMLLNLPFKSTTGTTVRERSPYLGSGVLQDGATPVVDPERGDVLNFDGVKAKVNMDNPPYLNAISGITIETFIKLDKAISAHGNSYPVIAGKRDTNLQRAFFLAFQKSTNRLYWEIKGTTGTYHVLKSNRTDFPVNQWIHFAATYDVESRKAVIYINGEFEAEGLFSALDEIPHTTADLRIGATNSYALDGSISHFRMHNRALSLSEIQENRTNVLDGLSLDLPLNELSEEFILSDHSGNDLSALVRGNAEIVNDDSRGVVLKTGTGSGSVLLPSIQSLGMNLLSFSLTFWAKADQLSSGVHPLISTRQADSLGNFEVSIENSKLKVNMLAESLTGTSSLEPGTWYQISIVYGEENGRLDLFINNRPEASRTLVLPLSGDAQLQLGKNDAGDEFNGNFSQIKVYDRAIPIAIDDTLIIDDGGELPGPVLYLKLDEFNQDHQIRNEIVNGLIASPTGTPKALPDDSFGSTMLFRSGDSLTVSGAPDLNFQDDLSLSAWVNIQEDPGGWVRICGKGDSANRNYGLWYHFGNQTWRFEQYGSGENLRLDYNGEAIKTGEWYYLSGVRKGQTACLYLNGQLLTSAGGLSLLPLTSSEDFTIGYAGFDAHHLGRITGVRLYDRALMEPEIDQDKVQDLSALAAFSNIQPIEFSFLDEHEQEVLFIFDDDQGELMQLEITNASRHTLDFSLLESAIPGPNNYHFELRFRPRVIDLQTLNQLTLLSGTGWKMEAQAHPEGSVSLYFLAETALSLLPESKHHFRIAGMGAEGTGGSRGTRVELRYGNMKFSGEFTSLKGRRIQHLSLQNQRSRRNVPLHIGFTDPPQILNDGSTQNNLRLRISNTLKNDALKLNPLSSDAPSRFILFFDVQEIGETKEWAIAEADEVDAFQVTAPGWTVTQHKETNPTSWILTHPSHTELPADEVIQIDIENIVTSLPSGGTNLYLRYENIPGYWDGQIVTEINEGPVIFNGPKVGIGKTDASEALDVEGNVKVSGKVEAADGLWVGPPTYEHDPDFPILIVPPLTPVATVEGSMIVHGQLSSKEGIKLGENGTDVQLFQAGLANVGAGGTGVKEVRIDFPEEFIYRPGVSVTPRNGTENAEVFTASLKKVTTSYALVNVMRLDSPGGSWTQQLKLDWMAWTGFQDVE